MKGSQFFSSIKETEETKEGREEGLKSSIIKSTCDGEELDLQGCKIALRKEKVFLSIF